MIPRLTQGQLAGATNTHIEEILNVLIDQINEHIYVMSMPLSSIKAQVDKIKPLEDENKVLKAEKELMAKRLYEYEKPK